MAIVETRVHSAHQLSDALPHRWGEASPGGLASGAVDQGRRPARSEAALEPLDLADAEPQRNRHLTIRELPGDQRFEQAGPYHLLAGHREALPCLHGGDTFT